MAHGYARGDLHRQPTLCAAIAERQVRLDPLTWGAHRTHGIVFNYVGEHEIAVAKFRDAIALAPTVSTLHFWLVMSEVVLGYTGEAKRELELAEQLLGVNRAVISLLDIAYGHRATDRNLTCANR